ncbi:MAG: TatD family hydrolase [Longimicrobiaceae bacterium]
MRLFDSHCHLTSERLSGDLDRVLAAADKAGVEAVVTVGTDPDDSLRAAKLAAADAGKSPRIYATAGVHPHDADGAGDGALARIRDLLDRPGVVAVGETGLDYHYQHSPPGAQRRSFQRQLELAGEAGLPVVVHSRDADHDLAAMIREHGAAVAGVLHCFTGGPELLEAGLEAGWYASFAGMVTFKNFTHEDAVRAVPGDRLLIETDSPYLAPVPYRGQLNQPAFVAEIARRVAAIRGQEPELLATMTSGNAARFYGLPVDGELRF